MRKCICLILLVFTAYGLLLAHGMLFAPRHRITLANLERIQVGMHYDEVEAIFGVGPGLFDGVTRVAVPHWESDNIKYHGPELVWASQEGARVVVLDGEKRIRLVWNGMQISGDLSLWERVLGRRGSPVSGSIIRS